MKIDLTIAKQKLLDMGEGQANLQTVGAYCGYINDTYEYFNRISEKSNKYLTNMIPFLNEF